MQPSPPPDHPAPASKRRVLALLGITALYVAAVDWGAFHVGTFWDLSSRVTEMPGRWEITTRFGGYLRDRRQTPPVDSRLIILGSSVVGTGFDQGEFTRAWADEPGVPHMQAENAWIMGSGVLDNIVASQTLATPPPRFLVFGLARRDVMDVPVHDAIVVETFYRAGMLPLRPSQPRGPWTAAQHVFRRVWPAYRHRVLVQGLALRFRPGLHDPRAPGQMGSPTPLAQLDPARGAWTRTLGEDIALLAPWADWCRRQGIRPVVLIMPVRSDRHAKDLVIDGPRSYSDRVEEVAAANGIWFFNFATMAQDEEFVEEDGIHNTPPGATRTGGQFARALAARFRSHHVPRP